MSTNSDIGTELSCSDALFELLSKLRAAQKAFFTERHGSLARIEALKESKRLEKALDAFIGSRQKPDVQKTLFDQ